MDSTASKFLLLPFEIRLKIYDYALPDEILLKTWRLRDIQGPIHKCAYQLNEFDESHTPHFLLTSRTIFNEVSPLLWARVVLDHTLYRTDSWNEHGRRSGLITVPKSNIYIPERFATQIRHVILPAFAGQYLKDSLAPFPRLQTVTIHVPGKTLTHALSEQIRLQLKASTTTPSTLNSFMRIFCHALPNAEWSQQSLDYTITQQLPILAKNYSLRIQLPPRRFRISRIALLDSPSHSASSSAASRVKAEEHHLHTARFRTKYLWNEDCSETTFDNVAMTATQATANTTFYHIARSGSHGGLTYDMRYEDHWLADAEYSFIDRLAWKELRERGLVDCAWVRSWRLAPQLR